MTEMSEQLGERIEELRRQRGLTQRELADQAGITPTYVSELENARTKNVGSSTLLAVADALGASLDYLLGRSEPRGEEKPLEIPPNLSAAASEEEWSYAETRHVLQAMQMRVAQRTESKRSVRGPEELSKEDWIDFHDWWLQGDDDPPG